MTNPALLHQVLLKFSEPFQEHRKDVSAVRLTPEKHLWLGSDETSTIERLTMVDAQTFAEHKQYRVAEFIQLPEAEDQEIDIEGLDYTDDYLWFVGSHSWKRKKPKPDKSDSKNIQRLTKIAVEANRYLLGRIPLVDGELLSACPHPENPQVELSAAKLEITATGNMLMDALADDVHLGAYVGATIPGKENGFDIEGIAVAEPRIFLGMRGPVLRGWAVMLEIELEVSDPGHLKLKPIGASGELYKKHFIYLNGLGIRDLCLDGDSLLILAGPTMDLDGPVRIYRLPKISKLTDEVLAQPEVMLEVPYGDGDDHAEGMTLFNSITNSPSLLMLYDAPAQQRLQGDHDLVADVFQLG